MLDFKEVLTGYSDALAEDKRRLINSITSKGSRAPVFLFGRNEHSLDLSNALPVAGFIDDFAERESYWHGKPVLRTEDLARESIVVNCVMNARPRTALERLRTAGFKTVLSYSDLCRGLPGLVPLPPFVSATRASVEQQTRHWRALFEELEDEQSRTVLNDVLRYRLTADCADLAAYAFRPQDQYFEPFMAFREEIFVDAGGYDGATTAEFCARYPDYRKVYFFEPSAQNLAVARARLAGYRAIEFLSVGLSDRRESLRFNSDRGSASVVSEEGDTSIEVTTLDSAVSGPVSFVKMDLEGWEQRALRGSARHIKADHPKLAIAVYHSPSDMWMTYELVKSLRPDYKVYLRHYTESWTETVMSFVPG